MRQLERSPRLNAKVRLRASIVRLNHAGWGVPRLAAHFGRDPQTVHNDLSRFEQFGVEGLADGKAPGMKPGVTPDIERFMQRKLEADRAWSGSSLGEAVREQFGVRIGREAIRVKLLELGYHWTWTCHAPGKDADPEVVAEHRASPGTPKRGHWTRR